MLFIVAEYNGAFSLEWLSLRASNEIIDVICYRNIMFIL